MILKLRQTGSISPRAERWLAALFICFHTVMSVSFSLGPILEGWDEIAHYLYIHILVTQGQLPNRVAYGTDTNELHQAPLYYIIGSLIVHPIRDIDFDTIHSAKNPYHWSPVSADPWDKIPPDGYDNKNVFFHGPNEAFPYTASGTALATHILRLYSALLGALTVITAYAIYRLLWPDSSAGRLLALGITCAWPTFQYMSSVITNDIQAVFLATLCVYLCLRMVRRGPSWAGAALVGLALGGAMITKANAPLLGLPIAVSFLVSGRRSWRYALATAGAAAVVAGWWYAYTYLVYQDPLALNAQYRMMPGLIPPGGHEPLAMLGERWIKTFQMVWARFGQSGAVGVPTYVGMAYDVISAAGIIGVVTLIAIRVKNGTLISMQSPRFRLWAVEAALGVAWVAGVTVFSYTNIFGIEGRQAMPGISAWAAGLTLGLQWWATSDRARARLVVVLPALMAALAIFSLAIFHAAYQVSPVPARIEFPRQVIFDNTVELIGVDQNIIKARGNDTIQFTLYWKALASTNRQVIVDVHTDHVQAFAVTSYSGTGNWPSSNWAAGQTWAEHYQVTLGQAAQPGSVLPVVIQLLDKKTNSPLPFTGAANAPLELPIIMYVSVPPE